MGVVCNHFGENKVLGWVKLVQEIIYNITDVFRTGKSLEIIPLGTTHLKIGKDRFEW